MSSKTPFLNLAIIAATWALGPSLFATDAFTGAIDSRWGEPGNWSQNRIPTVGGVAFIGPGDVVTVETAITGGARVVVGHNGVASLTVKSTGSYFYTSTSPVIDVGNNATGNGTLTVENGASLENGGNIRPGLNGSTATVNVTGDLIARGGLLIDATGTAAFNLYNGLFQVNYVGGLTNVEMDYDFNIEKGLFVSKFNTDGDLVDDLAALEAAGFITFSNGNSPGWGQTMLGFADYADIDYAITNSAGTDVLYIDYDAAGSTWDGDNSVVAMWVESIPVPATIHFDGTIDNNWDIPANWSLNRLPLTDDTAVLTGGDAVIIDSSVSTGTKVFIANSGSTASLTIENGGTLALGTAPLNVGQGGDGSLEVKSGATLTSNGLLRPANGATGSGTITVHGIVDINSGINVHSSSPAVFNLMNGRLRGNNLNGLDATDTNVTFILEKTLFVSKANTQGDLVDDLAALEANDFINFSNGNPPGWGQAMLGFTDYADIDYAITNDAGTDILYIDYDAPESSWDGDGTVVAMWVELIPVPATIHFDGTIDNNWDDPANWSLDRLPLTGDTAVLTGGDAVIIDSAVSTGTKVFIANSGSTASLTIENGGSLALGTDPLNVGQGGDGLLEVKSGATLTSNGLLRPANGATGSGTITVYGTVDINSGINVHSSSPAVFNLKNGRLRGNNLNGLDATDTNITFNIEKTLFVSKANTQNDLVDDLAALEANDFINFSNGRDPGWGKTQLGFDSYQDLDYAITNDAGTDILYIDYDAPGSSWDGDGTVVAMWVERIHTPLTYHVSTAGSNSNDGLSSATALRTIDEAANRVVAGDTVLIQAGSYEETVAKGGLIGLPDAPITFKSDGSGPVIVDGTVSIADVQADTWTHHGNGIYRTTLTQDVWQLFLGSEMMMEGRWPNASFDDGSLWDRDEWAHSTGTSSNGNLITDTSGSKPDLAATGVSFEGGWLVFNGGQWNTLLTQNFSHSAGSNTITYNTWNNFRGTVSQHRYFITAHLDCVDVEGEWYYDNPTNVLYFKPPGGGTPSGDLRGRVRRWGFDLNNTSNVVIEGIEFFGCSLEVTSSPDFVIEDCKFKFYNAQQRVLNSGQWSTPLISGLRATIRNCEFSYADGRGFDMNNAANSVIENVLMHDIDWTGGGSSTFHMGGSSNVRVSGFSMYNTGASEGLHMGTASVTELCRVGPTVGSLQQDGAPIHFNPYAYENSVIRYCWTLDHGKRGGRGDVNNGSTDFQGTGILIHHNVARGCAEGGLSSAGDWQQIYNNTSFSNNRPDIYLIEKGSFVHANTTTRNNATDFNGIANRLNRHAGQPPPGVLSNNWDDSNVSNQLVAPSHNDFRPKASSPLVDGAMPIAGITDGHQGPAPDIGAYEHGDINYWIPGFRTAEASMAIPPNGSTNQSADRDLIWLGGWESTSYDIYFGTSESSVNAATRLSPEYRGNQTNNIFKPYPLSNTTCYWRIDSVTPTGTIKGHVWQLTFGNVPNTPYQSWELEHGINGSGPSSNPDQDLYTNEFEYYFGLDPASNYNAREPFANVNPQTNQRTFTYTYRANDPNVTYAVEVSSDLVTWIPASVIGVLNSTPNADGTTTVTLLMDTESNPGTAIFFRAVASN